MKKFLGFYIRFKISYFSFKANSFYLDFRKIEKIIRYIFRVLKFPIGQAIAIQQSQAEKNRSAAAAKYKKQMIKEQQRM